MLHEDAQVQSTPTAPLSSGMTDFEREQIRVARLKAWLTAGSIITSVAAAILAYSSAQWIQSQQAADAFQLKAAEIVMASRTSWEAQSKARALAGFFPNRVPPSMADKFDPKKHSWGRESHRELLTLLLTAHPPSPEHRAVVLGALTLRRALNQSPLKKTTRAASVNGQAKWLLVATNRHPAARN